MKISTEQYERLMRFLDLDMSATEMKAFAEELDTSQELREQLDFEEEVRDGTESIYGLGKKDLPVISAFTKEALAQFRNNAELTGDLPKAPQDSVLPFDKVDSKAQSATQGANKGKVLKINFSLSIAASLLVAVGLIYLFNAGGALHNDLTTKSIDTNNIEKDNNNLVKTPQDTATKTPLKRDISYAGLFKSAYKKDTAPMQKPEMYASALNDYNDNYYRTIQKINPDNLPEIRGTNTDSLNDKKLVATIGHYYTGLSFIETGNLQSAIKNLQWVKDSAANINYITKAQWYLALAYLKEGKMDNAKLLLQRIIASGTIPYYKREAKNLLKKME